MGPSMCSPLGRLPLPSFQVKALSDQAYDIMTAELNAKDEQLMELHNAAAAMERFSDKGDDDIERRRAAQFEKAEKRALADLARETARFEVSDWLIYPSLSLTHPCPCSPPLPSLASIFSFQAESELLCLCLCPSFDWSGRFGAVPRALNFYVFAFALF